MCNATLKAKDWGRIHS